MAVFSRRDVRDCLALIDGARSATGPEAFADAVVRAVARLVPGDVVGYQERDLVSHGLLMIRELPSGGSSPEISATVGSLRAEYLLSTTRHHADARALKVSDFASWRELHELDDYEHVLRPLGVEAQLRVWLTAPPGIARHLYVSRRRAHGDFNERDRDLLELVRPLLASLRARFDVPTGGTSADHDLTDRETEILTWVARGKTNQEIAALLVLSPHTVRKHLERTYEKLRVHTRTAAVARALYPP
jgi:DNA-binding CsgD family transcriptional regulator